MSFQVQYITYNLLYQLNDGHDDGDNDGNDDDDDENCTSEKIK